MALPSSSGDEPPRRCAPLLIFPGNFPAGQQLDEPGEYHADAGQNKEHAKTRLRTSGIAK